MRIGFVGTGTMGTPIAGCLDRGRAPADRLRLRPEATAALVAQGARSRRQRALRGRRRARWCSPRCPGPTEVEAAVLEPQTGILAGLRAGAAYIDLTTNAPETIRPGRRGVPRQRGVAFLDAPVSGRPPNMTVMVGGSDADFARCRPLFEAIAANVFHVGPSGAGCTAKLVTQYLGYTNFIAALEGMLVAAKAGIDLDVLAKIVPVSAGQSRTFDNIPRRVLDPRLRLGRHARHRRQGRGARR